MIETSVYVEHMADSLVELLEREGNEIVEVTLTSLTFESDCGTYRLDITDVTVEEETE